MSPSPVGRRLTVRNQPTAPGVQNDPLSRLATSRPRTAQPPADRPRRPFGGLLTGFAGVTVPTTPTTRRSCPDDHCTIWPVQATSRCARPLAAATRAVAGPRSRARSPSARQLQHQRGGHGPAHGDIGTRRSPARRCRRDLLCPGGRQQSTSDPVDRGTDVRTALRCVSSSRWDLGRARRGRASGTGSCRGLTVAHRSRSHPRRSVAGPRRSDR